MRIYFDSCIIIYLVERTASWHPRVDEAFTRLGDPPPTVVFSDLNRLERRAHPLETNDLSSLAAFDDFFSRVGLSYQPMNAGVFDLATELRARHRLKTPDALHGAAAITAHCDAFWTNDHRLADALSDRIEIFVPA
ncbi:MAG: type II toxin-antitoxin system VapC family toxin [Burkholderiales bacterium]